MTDELEDITMDTIHKTLEGLDVRREKLYIAGKISEAEYNRLYVFKQDIVSMLSMGFSWTIHLTADTIRMEDREDVRRD